MPATFRPLRVLRLPARAPIPTLTRPFSLSASIQARKDTMDKDSLKPAASEYSKSGSDDAAAQHEDAFDGGKTKPEEQLESAGGEGGEQSNNPLNASPANQEISKPGSGTEGKGGSEGSSAQSGKGPSDRQRTSGGSKGEHKAGGTGKKYD